MVSYPEWSSPSGFSAGNLITGDGTSGDLKNLADTYTALGPEVDNQGGDFYGGIQLKIRLASGPSGSPYVNIWFLLDLSDSQYEDGNAGSPGTVPARPPDLRIPVRLVTTQQYISVAPVMLPNAKFKALLENQTGVALTNTNDENQLTYQLWPEQVT